jgi:DNA-directed RNA polymerase beta' subunit
MMSTNNILSPANGEPVIVPSQDIVLGLYYMTKEKPGALGENRSYASAEEVRVAFDAGALELQAKIEVGFKKPPELVTAEELLKRTDLADVSSLVEVGGLGRIFYPLEDTNSLETSPRDLSGANEKEPGEKDLEDETVISLASLAAPSDLNNQAPEGELLDSPEASEANAPRPTLTPVVARAAEAPADLSLQILSSLKEALADNSLSPQAQIVLKRKRRLEATTCGRVLLSEIIPPTIAFSEVNKVMNKNELRNLIAKCYRVCGTKETVVLTDHLKDLGYKFATKAGISLCISNMIIPKSKNRIIEKAQSEILEVDGQYKDGLITEGEKYNKVVDIWTRASNDVAEQMMSEIKTTKLDGQPLEDQGAPGFNPIYMMADSGARGSKDQMRQLAGMRGLMAKPTGEIIEQPITANFREGLTVLQYFVSTHGARKGLADTALKTANSGYLTRRLVDVAQDSIILEKDCGTLDGIEIEALRDAGEIRQTLTERILGRVALFDIISPIDNEVLVAAGEEIGEEEAEAIEKSGLTKILIRSVLTCRAQKGVCAKCYGRDLAHGKLVEIGESIGIIAAQSIGEPGTQLTMRTFHIGGTASRRAEKNVISTDLKGVLEFSPDVRLVKNVNNELVVMSRKGELIIRDEKNLAREKHDLIYGAHLKLKPRSQPQAIEMAPVEELDMAGIGPYIQELSDKVAALPGPGGDKVEMDRLNQRIKPLAKRLRDWAEANDFLTSSGGLTDKAKYNPELYELTRLWPQILETLNATDRLLSEYELKLPEEARRLAQDFELTPKDSGEFVEWDPFTQPILTEVSGFVSFEDMEEGKTMVEKVDVVTGKSSKVIVESKLMELRPLIKVVTETGSILKNSKGSPASYQLPVNAILMVEEKSFVRAGDALAKIPRETTKTKDITGGLPRVAELFEVRKPKEVAVISEIDGVISFDQHTKSKGKRKIIVTPEIGEPKEYLIPKGKHVTVHEGDFIRAGESLMDGSANPHDILSIRGVKDLAKYLVDEVQQVYRLQSVKINDKHIEVIVRQMLRKVRVKAAGDTEFLVGESVDRQRFEEINEAIMLEGKRPATAEPLLQGITKASLSTESFISAASFQETTKVLTEAAVAGKVDTLAGLKENVIMGRLIPAGTGLQRYQYAPPESLAGLRLVK